MKQMLDTMMVKSDMNVIAKDAAMDLAGTKKQMGGFEFSKCWNNES